MGQPKSPTSAEFRPENPLFKNVLKMFLDKESADVVFEVNESSERETTPDLTATSTSTFDGKCAGNQSGCTSVSFINVLQMFTKGEDPADALLKDNISTKKRNHADKTSTASFHAHRAILQAGAPRLAELCKPSDGRVTSVPIMGVSPVIFCHVLYYIYGGEVAREDLTSNALDLIKAAEIYGVGGLKLQAEMRYVETTTLTVDNLLENLVYADSQNCALLKEAVMDFIVKNGDNVMEQVSFDGIPGSVVTDLLAAAQRGKKKGGDSDSVSSSATSCRDYNNMRVSNLRKRLQAKGLDATGSRKTMVALLKENS